MLECIDSKFLPLVFVYERSHGDDSILDVHSNDINLNSSVITDLHRRVLTNDMA